MAEVESGASAGLDSAMLDLPGRVASEGNGEMVILNFGVRPVSRAGMAVAS